MSDRKDWRRGETAREQSARVGGAAPGVVPRGSGRGTSTRQSRTTSEDKKPRNVPGVGRVALVSTEDGTTLRARLDDGYPLFFGGYGGWEDEPRPGQVSATVFRGAQAPQLKLKLILGRWPLARLREGRSPFWATDCDRAMRMLEGFARLPVDGPRQDRPALLRIRGHVPHHNRRWFVQDVEWGEVDLAGRRRVRALVTVTLRMYVPVDLLGHRERNARPTQWYPVKRGERIDQIIHHKLEARGYKEWLLARRTIHDLNRLRAGESLDSRRRIKLPRGNWWRTAKPSRRATGRAGGRGRR